MTGRRVVGMLAATLGVVAAMPPAAAALLAWTLVATPLTATASQLTTFTLTATNLDLLSELGCLEVVLADSYQNVSASGASASNGDPWTASAFESTVVVRSLSGGGRLELLQTVTFTISARPTAAGVTTWANHAHLSQDCTGADQAGLPLAVTVRPPTPTPTPAPTAPPTPTPTPTPIVTLPTPSASLPVPSLPVPLPSIHESTSPAPTIHPGATASPAPSSSASVAPGQSGGAPTPSASAAAAPSASSGAGGSAPGGSAGTGSGDPASRLPSLRFDERQLDLGGASVGLFAGVETWAVPAATIALPGLLVLVWVAIQAGGAIAWMPAVRRLRREEGPRRRKRFQTPTP